MPSRFKRAIPNNIGEDHALWNSSIFSCIQSYVIPSPFGSDIFTILVVATQRHSNLQNILISLKYLATTFEITV
jgi:hypothetical protein